ncbi:adenylate cyclase type 3-like [Ylistrum balloti]|uniref:adenylate cyclase type 3-like n=1 Tax=Ylistrum balloti TaxID=509963 RepID=UPI002905F3D0|nr:adenylate cyclase type 3-like [Ylistrum balloti]
MIEMNSEVISVGVPTNRFRSCDTINDSVDTKSLFRFDLTNYYTVCRFQRDRDTFKSFVWSDIVSLLDILPIMGVLYNICAILVIYLQCPTCFPDTLFYVHLVAAMIHCILCGVCLIKTTRTRLPVFHPLFPVLIIIAVILWDGTNYLTGYAYLWLQVLIFINMMTFSGRLLFSLPVCLILFSSVLIPQGIQQYTQSHEWIPQIIMNVIVFLCMMSHGFAAYFSLENEYLMTFLEDLRLSKYKKIVSEEQMLKNNIMKASFPKRIAEEITRAFDIDSCGPFRKMYISKNDNVTIVFADIVGFTTISSFYSAERLVALLNDIFLSFDRIADKYHQLRLKILGDCYYCICGIPEPKEDHASLSVSMGFGIMDAISVISSKMKMRVGVHTGSVLSGVLGLSQWQFDVLGQDVKIANLMESSGVPGKVHITHVTRALLSDDYVITPSNAGEKVDFLKRAGIRTFFISQSRNKEHAEIEEEVSDILDSDDAWDTHEISDICDTTIGEMNVYPVSLGFRNIITEKQYLYRRQFLGLQPYPFVFVLMVVFTNNFTSFFKSWNVMVSSCLGSVIMLLNVLTMTEGIDGLSEKTLIVHFAENVLIFISAIFSLFAWLDTDVWTSDNETSSIFNATGNATPDVESPMTFVLCDYVYLRLLLLMIGVNETVKLRHSLKCLIVVLFAFVSLMHLVHLHPNGKYTNTAEDMISPAGTVLSFLVIIVLMNRKVETVKRKMFLQRTKAIGNHELLRKLRRKNKDLLYNLIFPDIARDLLSKPDLTHALSQSYDEVGVMFAACPHFDEFYTENCNYEDGMGCVRFLNEIISDYDELIQEPEFKNLCKIKTIGATYMVASGLQKHFDCTNTEENDRSRRREHLALLVRFALKMMDVVESISQESFTNFKLRIGINHGPLTAGVIAHKPHYDIFGNTVNVASRMESTGVIDKIQVLKNTAQVLQKYGYSFKSRGPIDVKGKGSLVTYLLSRSDSHVSSTREDHHGS